MASEIPSIPVFEASVFSDILPVLEELTKIFSESTVSTHHQLESILSPILRSNTKSRIHSACEIIFRSILKEFGRISAERCEHPMQALAQHCQDIGERWLKGPEQISQYLQPFLQRAHTVLIHGHSRVICESLLHAFGPHRIQFIFTEGSPLQTGQQSVDYLVSRWEERTGNTDIKAALSIVPDSAMAAVIPYVSFILVSATTVTTSGGATGMIGSHQIALLANALGIDFYTVAEVFRFSRIFPLTSKDIQHVHDDPALEGYSHTNEFPLVEYVPPNLINMYFTNIGLFPPVTAGDELYRIFVGDSSGKTPLFE
mmetsp:Transcript_40329/g.63814  ORF Transcript_40329/g.63814 Transcript_40329/m.63814 type:complete len:314 (-) Transcript_40329:23-964(-)